MNLVDTSIYVILNWARLKVGVHLGSRRHGAKNKKIVITLRKSIYYFFQEIKKVTQITTFFLVQETEICMYDDKVHNARKSYYVLN